VDGGSVAWVAGAVIGGGKWPATSRGSRMRKQEKQRRAESLAICCGHR